MPRNTTFDEAVQVAKAMEGARSFSSKVTSGVPAAAARFMDPPRRQQQQQTKCKYCGGQPHHGNQSCPAYGHKCTRCKRVNHYEAVCLSSGRGGRGGGRGGRSGGGRRNPNDGSDDEEDDGSQPSTGGVLLLSANMTHPKMVARYTHVPGKPDPMRPLTTLPVQLIATRDNKYHASVAFLPDSGSNITCITKKMLSAMGISVEQLAYREKAAARTPLLADGQRSRSRCLGIMRGTLNFQGRTFEEDVYVYSGEASCLLSRWACFGLGILHSEVLDGGQPPKGF